MKPTGPRSVVAMPLVACGLGVTEKLDVCALARLERMTTVSVAIMRNRRRERQRVAPRGVWEA